MEVIIKKNDFEDYKQFLLFTMELTDEQKANLKDSKSVTITGGK